MAALLSHWRTSGQVVGQVHAQVPADGDGDGVDFCHARETLTQPGDVSGLVEAADPLAPDGRVS
jgi:hypothetical protein